MNEPVQTISLSIDMASIICALITTISAYLINKRKALDVYDQKRYEELNYPNFIELEPFLYKYINDTEINNNLFQAVHNIIDRTYEKRIYANTNLFDLIDIHSKILSSEKSYTQSHFNFFCTVISKEYDLSCKKLGIQKRSYWYKHNRHQYVSHHYMDSFREIIKLLLGLSIDTCKNCFSLIFYGFLLVILCYLFQFLFSVLF